ncbi:MAG TPA: hypothetical protein VK390_09845 [Propionibacteriaceae bacterium]|nr:hypothetical protein [Propionibacteriaceae bacterium]
MSPSSSESNIRDYDPAPALAFVRAFNLPYPSIYDPRGAELVKFTDLPPSGIPSTLLIAIAKAGSPPGSSAPSPKTTLTQMITDIAAEQ